MTNNDIQNITQKKQSATNPTKTGGELRCSERESSFYSISTILLSNRSFNDLFLDKIEASDA
jgi:hypothetical protein